MAGLDPAIQTQKVGVLDARLKAGHDGPARRLLLITNPATFWDHSILIAGAMIAMTAIP